MRRPSPDRGPRGRAARLALAASILCGVLALAWVLWRGPGSSAEPSPMFELGRQALEGALAGEGDERDGVVRFRLNGNPVRVAGGRTEGTMLAVLTEARRRCVAEAPNDPLALVEALRSPEPSASIEDGPPLVLGSMAVADGQGFVACLDRFAAPPARGALRYVYAREPSPGGAPTRFVVVWTRALVTFASLSRRDASGDVLGADVPGLPRPEGARRRSSFVRADGSRHLVVYETTASPETIARWAEAALPRAGWSSVRAARGDDGVYTLRARRAQRNVHIVVRPDETMVVIATGQGSPQSPSR